jgi:hypothetical protein
MGATRMTTTKRRVPTAIVALSALAVGLMAGCRKEPTGSDDGQIGAAVGEMMASLDESAQGSVTADLLPLLPALRIPDALRGSLWHRAAETLFPSAEAATCGEAAFSACSAGMRTRSFSSCSLAMVATLDGSVSLAFTARPLCTMAVAGDAVTRTASFSVTGLYGGMLTVTSPGGGQTLTRTATGFEYKVGGMERTLTGPAGRTLFDITAQTTAPIEVTGSSRADRVIVSGTLQVTHHLAGYAVSLTPDHLAWSAGCNCAVSGRLTGLVSGGAHDGKSATVELTGCGEADVTIDGQTESITLDRCVAQ